MKNESEDDEAEPTPDILEKRRIAKKRALIEKVDPCCQRTTIRYSSVWDEPDHERFKSTFKKEYLSPAEQKKQRRRPSGRVAGIPSHKDLPLKII